MLIQSKRPIFSGQQNKMGPRQSVEGSELHLGLQQPWFGSPAFWETPGEGHLGNSCSQKITSAVLPKPMVSKERRQVHH